MLVDLLLKLNICEAWVRNGLRSIRFHANNIGNTEQSAMAREWGFGALLRR